MKENDVIWVSIEESDKYELRQSFNRYFNGYFWFKEDEPFDIINNALRKDNMGVFKFIVINDKIE